MLKSRSNQYSFKISYWTEMIVNISLIATASSYNYLQDNYKSGGTSVNNYTAQISRIPHHTLIVYTSFYCSGSLVWSRIVITAASCFEKRLQNESIIVKLGSSHITELTQVVEVVEVKIHEYYGYSSERNNDIALLILRDHVAFGQNVKKIVMVEPEIALRSGTVLGVSGWGSSDLKPNYVNALLFSQMVVLDLEDCQRVYNGLITSSNFCVKYQMDRRLSDNGGPAQFNRLLVGLVSFGAANPVEPFVAVLTNISYFYKWIMLNSNRLMQKYCSESTNTAIVMV